MELKVINKAFAIDISQSKLTAAKGELVVEQEKSAVYVKEVKEFNYDNEGIEELIKFLGEGRFRAPLRFLFVSIE